MAIRVLVADVDPTLVHGETVKNGVIEGYGLDIAAQVQVLYYFNMTDAWAYAQANNINLVVRPSDDAYSLTFLAGQLYPGLLTVMPLGSNSHVKLLVPVLSAIVTIAQGATEADTAFGPGLEFFAETGGGSSRASGIIAGQMLRVYDNILNTSWPDVRERCHRTGTQNGVWDEQHGWGKINVEAAIAYAYPLQFIEDVGVLLSPTTHVIYQPLS